MGKPSNHPNFKKLHEKWVHGTPEKPSILEQEGFPDAENKDGTLKQYDRRNQTFDNRENVAALNSALGEYLNDPTTSLNPVHRDILERHHNGDYQVDIQKAVKRSDRTVRDVIKKHETIVIQRMQAEPEADAAPCFPPNSSD
jgi:hypothetical protein